jgi:predicted nuclease of restriction endonuclease-like RecB superfamily
MDRISWDEYESALTESKKAALFGKRTPINDATKAAKRILEEIAKKFKINPKELIRNLYESVR